MMKIDQQTRPAMLDQFKEHGGYVPRFFFLTPDGKLNAAITSGHPRFPYFFANQQVEALKAAMKRAIGS